MSESNSIPSLNKLAASEYIPSGRFGVEHSNPEQQEARHDVAEALASAATINHAPRNSEVAAAPLTSEAQPTPEVLPLDYIRMASSNLVIVRRAAQSDFDLAA